MGRCRRPAFARTRGRRHPTLLAAVVLVAGVGQRAAAEVSDGAAITPAFAQALYSRIAPLQEADGCKLSRFDTGRVRITIGLQPRAGPERTFDLATASLIGGGQRRVGDWALAVPPELEAACGQTVAAIERVLGETNAPQGSMLGVSGLSLVSTNFDVLAVSFVLLVLATVRILIREVQAQRPPPGALLALALTWAAALGLRLLLSPRTFLHEYYHVAETVTAYLLGEVPPAYGQTGPALFRAVGALLGRPQDLRIIFLTNAVLASLAVPAIALLDLQLMQSWPQAFCAAVLLAVLPLHLRFSAAEDLFVQAVTFGLWALALFALYVRTRRLDDALVAALALSLAMQTRPDMLFFPAVLVGMLLLTNPRAWGALFAWRTLLALGVLGVLLVPRLIELRRALHDAPAPAAVLPDLHRWADRLVFGHAAVTPPVYWLLVGVGALWCAWRRPGLLAWVGAVFVGFTCFSLSMFDNPPWNLRSQLLPTTLLLLIAAATASVWLAVWRRRQRVGLAAGTVVLALLSVAILVRSHGFVTELRDQQLEFAFLERSVPRLPPRATLLTAATTGGHNLDAFPEFLLRDGDKRYDLIDVRSVAGGELPWPPADEQLLFYQGMFCYFAFDDEPPPEPMSAPCRAVHERYVAEPLLVEDLDTAGYSYLRYAPGPYRVGFYRLTTLR